MCRNVGALKAQGKAPTECSQYQLQLRLKSTVEPFYRLPPPHAEAVTLIKSTSTKKSFNTAFKGVYGFQRGIFLNDFLDVTEHWQDRKSGFIHRTNPSTCKNDGGKSAKSWGTRGLSRHQTMLVHWDITPPTALLYR